MPEPTQPEPVSSQTTSSGLSDNAAGGIAYITFIPAIIFLVIEPFNKNSYVRFHSWQSIFLAVVGVGINILTMILRFIPGMGVLSMLIGLALFVVWIIVLIKAFNGVRFKLPIIGDLAEKQAGS